MRLLDSWMYCGEVAIRAAKLSQGQGGFIQVLENSAIKGEL